MRLGTAVALLLVILSTQATPVLRGQPSLRVVGAAWILAPAVAETPTGLVGVTSNISVLVTEGWGDVYVSTFSLTERDFQGAAATAARVAARLAGVNFTHYNFYFEVRGNAVVVGGPSAGVAMTAAAYAALTGARINRSVAVTGMVAPDGSVGPVGGVYEKAWAASRAGVKLFIVPPGQSVVIEYKRVERRLGPFVVYQVEPVKINLSSYALSHWGLRVVEAATVREALRYIVGAEIPAPRPGRPFLGPEARSRVSTVRGLIERRAWGELKSVLDRVKASSLPDPVKARLIEFLEGYGYSQLRSAGSLPPYSAARLHAAEQALAAARWASLILDYYGGGNLSERLRGIEARWNSTAAGLESTGAPTRLDAQAQLLAADALAQAARDIDAARDAWRRDPEEALRLLAQASVLVDEADAWAGGLPQGTPRAADEASLYLLAARGTWPYVKTIAQETGVGASSLIGEAEDYYVLAARLYARGLPLVAAAAASRSLALAQAAMDLVQLALSGQPVYLEYSARLALAACGPDALASVYYYNLSSLYTGYGERLVLFKLASQAGELTHSLSGGAAAPQGEARGEEKAGERRVEAGRGMEEYLRKAYRLLWEKGYLQLAVPALILLAILLVVARLAGRRKTTGSAETTPSVAGGGESGG